MKEEREEGRRRLRGRLFQARGAVKAKEDRELESAREEEERRKEVDERSEREGIWWEIMSRK